MNQRRQRRLRGGWPTSIISLSRKGSDSLTCRQHTPDYYGRQTLAARFDPKNGNASGNESYVDSLAREACV